MRRIVAFVIFAVTLFTLAVINTPYIVQNANLGVEFKGGYEIAYEVASKEEGNQLSETEIAELTEAAADVIVTRLDITGVKNPIVTVEDGMNTTKQIRVTVGAVKYSEFKAIKDIIESDVELSFRDINDVDLVQKAISENNTLGDGSDLLGEQGATVQQLYGQYGLLLDINNTPLFSYITSYLSTRQETAENKLIVWMNYAEGDSYAEESVKENGKIIVAIDITQTIAESNPYIQGNFTPEYAQTVSNKLKAGSIDFKLVSTGYETKIEASYGEDALTKVAFGAMIAFALIAIVLIVIYGIPSIAALISLVAYVAACLASLNFLGAELGPDALTAIVAGAGLALNSSIIVFERIKDELLKGRNLKKAFEEGTKKSLSSVIDSNLVALVVGLVLFFLGTRTVKTFATMLFLCIFFSLVIMVILLKVFLSFLFKTQLLSRKKNLFGVKINQIPNVKENEQQTYFGPYGKTNFTKHIRKFAAISVVVTLLGGIFFGVYSLTGTPLNLGSQFAPGTRISIVSDIEEYNDVNEIHTLLTGAGMELATSDIIQATSTDAETGNTYPNFIITIEGKELSGDQVNAITTALSGIEENEIYDVNFFDYEISNVSAKVALMTLSNASMALGLAALFVIVYLMIRFKPSYALASVVTLFFNLTAVAAVFVIFRLEVNTEFIPAILAIATYGIYDVVIVFDRLRENVNEVNKKNLSNDVRFATINKTLQQTFSRSIVSFACMTLIPLALAVFGSQATIYLSLALLFGFIISSLNSVFLAPMIWLYFANRFNRFDTTRKFKPKKQSDEPEEVVFLGVND